MNPSARSNTLKVRSVISNLIVANAVPPKWELKVNFKSVRMLKEKGQDNPSSGNETKYPLLSKEELKKLFR